MTTKKKTHGGSLTGYDGEYDAFIHGLELIGLGLKSSHSEIDRRAYFSMEDEQSEKEFRHKYRITHIGEASFDAEGSFELTVSASERKTQAAKMACVFEVHVHGKAPIAPQHVERFVKSELRLILVPHVRQFFFAMSGQMAIPPVVLPLMTRSGVDVKKKMKRVALPGEISAPEKVPTAD